MKSKKLREIALLTLPVLAIAAIVPGARWLGNWREANKLPRVEACYLRAPTAWEAYNGADVAYTLRALAPQSTGPTDQWELNSTISNDRNEFWTSRNQSWRDVTIARDTSHSSRGKAEILGNSGGVRWQKIVGHNGTAQMHATLERVQLSNNKVLQSVARDFVLTDPVAPLPLASLRSANFRLEKIELQTFYGGFPELTHRFTLSVRPADEKLKTSLNVQTAGDWQLLLLPDDKETGLTYDVLTSRVPDESGLAAVTMNFNENHSYLRDKSAYISGLLSIAGGWPQLIRIELPQGLPTKPGTINLPFTAKLAPLPK